MSHILITGASGLIGTRLSQLLLEKNYKVAHLSRSKKNLGEIEVFQWDISAKKIEEGAIERAGAIIHLAGAGIADKRWTIARKKELVDSRVKSTRLLATCLKEKKHQVKQFVSASGIGFYGERGSDMLSETEGPDDSFLSEICQAWEKTSEPVADLGIKRVVLRIGIVLSKEGGALPQTALPVRFHLGSYFGNGKMYYSWIHLDDICRMIITAIENEQMEGIYNAAAPNPVMNKVFVKGIAKAMGKKALMLPTPIPILKLALGEMSDMITFSTRVSAEKIKANGFEFLYPELDGALAEIYEK